MQLKLCSWVLEFLLRFNMYNCMTDSSLWCWSSLCHGLDIVKFDTKLGHRKVFPKVSQSEAWKAGKTFYRNVMKQATAPPIFYFLAKTWIEPLWKSCQKACYLGVPGSNPALSSVFSRFSIFLFHGRISIFLHQIILWSRSRSPKWACCEKSGGFSRCLIVSVKP